MHAVLFAVVVLIVLGDAYPKGAAPVPDWFVADTLSYDNNPLASWFANRTANGQHDRRAQKWSQYLNPYHRHLHKFRGKEVNLVEMGVQSGGSLHMWLDYFGEKASVYGVDIDSHAQVVERDRPGRVRVFLGDQGDPDFLRRLCNEIGRIDFILDDASHVPWHQILGVEMLFPCLNPDGGVYMVEDLGTETHLGKLANESIVAYAHARAADLQVDTRQEVSMIRRRDAPMKLSRDRKKAPITMWQRQLNSVHVYGSLVVFEKIRERDHFILDAGQVIIPKRTVGFVGLSRGDAEARAEQLRKGGGLWV